MAAPRRKSGYTVFMKETVKRDLDATSEDVLVSDGENVAQCVSFPFPLAFEGAVGSA